MLNIQFCLEEMQGKLFENAAKLGYDSENFVRLFMRSQLASQLDMDYSRMQFVDEEYWMEELQDTYGDKLAKGTSLSPQEMFWLGYIYRSWHHKTGESSREILKRANFKKMTKLYTTEYYNDCDSVLEQLG